MIYNFNIRMNTKEDSEKNSLQLDVLLWYRLFVEVTAGLNERNGY